MSTSWYSINITVNSVSVFNGYFSVDNTINVIQQFYNVNAIGTNILDPIYPNQFINGNFTNNSTGITSIPSLDSTYNANLWLLGADSKKGPLTYILSYRQVGGVVGTINLPVIFTTAPTTDPTPPPTVLICFPAGTPIVTDQGEIEIEKINPTKNTIRSKKIVAITKTVTIEDSIVCIQKDTLGENIPSKETYISRNHKLLYNKQMIKAKELIGNVEGIYNKKYNGEILYNVLLETCENMIVNNLIVETLDPENIVAKLYNGSYSAEERNKIVVHINQCANNYKKLHGHLK